MCCFIALQIFDQTRYIKRLIYFHYLLFRPLEDPENDILCLEVW